MRQEYNTTIRVNKFFLGLYLITIALLLWGVWHFYVDGIHVNKVIKPINGYDPLNIQVEKESYARGEVVRGYASFCKMRDATGTTQWTLHNEVLDILPVKVSGRAVAVGCYEDVVFPIYEIPDHATIGEHYFSGVSQHKAPDGRVWVSYYQTEKFTVVD